MATDGWGIDDGYQDARGEWRTIAPETIAAVRAAMDAGGAPPSAERRIQVVRQHQTVRIPSGRLYLEDGSHVDLRRKRLPPDIPIGYHDFRPKRGEGPSIRFIVTPGRCPLPKRGLWGWAGQLYAARSQDSWGFGDLADLRRLAVWARSHGAGFLLVNPLSAASPVTPQQPSPYYPASRRFLNPLYLRIEEVPGAASVAGDLEWLATAGKALNEQRVIDRNKVFELKMHALEKIFGRVSSDRAFERYCAERRRDLAEFATFCVLAEKLGGDWRAWPSEFQRSGGPAVARFVDDNRERIRFHQWLQWLLDEQLARAGEESAIVQDLAIGVDPGGADAWVWQDLYAQSCTVGAPPDLYNRQGQDWGLPPFIPHKLRAAGYEPFVQTLRATLRHSRGLRIDHVMGLFRLYWVPHGLDATHGAFVRYPADEMLAIVAIESQRAGAFVVGEDLGTVDEEIRALLAAHRVLSYRLLWFEDEPPASYPELSMAAVTTHDLPTVAGLWDGHDVRAQRALGLDPNEEGLRAIRDKLASLGHLDEEARADDVVDRAYQLLSGAASYVATASLDDALAVNERPNMPCTTTQWPNWSLALPGGIEALEKSPLAGRIAAAMRKRGRTKRLSKGATLKDRRSPPVPGSATHGVDADQTVD
ncbi:MAG TPA: 4-alpha-glucanotransferase [Pirellulales bacterium]|nr:4-alpha-glucanotransferase [Pirellulales bacterium]